MKTLVIVASFALAPATAANAAGNTSAARCQPHQEDDASLGRCSPLVLASPAAITALLAEYLTSCGGKAKPEVEQVALRIIARMDYQKWLETVSHVHIVRDKQRSTSFA